MDKYRWAQIRALFEELRELDDSERQVRLAALTDQDPSLAAEVAALLTADVNAQEQATELHQELPQFFDDMADTSRRVEQSRWAGKLLGPWRILHEIGQGGMGTVFLAERADGAFEQKVALKLVRPDWNRDELQVRFRVERQILATLDHPNIARLLDGGVTDDEHPWLVLEYVDGLSLTHWCDQNRLPLNERLKMFLAVCEAVAHAHDRLVVHRDLKPSNILVSRQGQVKLLDFGVAKLLEQDVGPSITRPEQRLLTPEYASPEQLRGDVITTASDIHALGLLLFELLTGRRPYKISTLSARAWERAILDQEPERPSQRASQPTPDATDSDPVTREEIAQRRQLQPDQLRRELSGDLDAIILKTLRKNPAERYASVRELIDDVRAHLDHRPVRARRGSTRYLVSRWLRRHALAASLASLALLAMLLGTAVSLWQASEARIQRDLALAEATKSAAIRDFMLDVFRRADPARSDGREISARDLLDEAASRFERMHLRDASSEADLLQAMAEAYQAVGANEVAERLLARVLTLRESVAGDPLAEVDAIILQARVLKNLGDLSGSMQALERAEAMLEPGRHQEHWARLWMTRGITQITLRHLEEAVANLERGSNALAAVHGETDDRTLMARAVLAWSYESTERYEAIERLIAPLLQQVLDDPSANPVLKADLLDAYANAKSAQGEHAATVTLVSEALEITRQVYGENHRHAVSRLNNLAFALHSAQRLNEAAEAMRRVLELNRQHYAPGARRIGSAASNLARIEVELGLWDSAEQHISEGIAIRETAEDKTDLSFSLVTAASIARGAGQHELAAQRLALAQHWYEAMPNKPTRLLLRLHLEQAEQDLGNNERRECRGSLEAQALHRQPPLSADRTTLAYVELVAHACAARAGDAAALAELPQRLSEAMNVLGEESVRRVWAQRYVSAATERG